MRADVPHAPAPIAGLRRVGQDGLLLEASSAAHVAAITAAIHHHLGSDQPAWRASDVIPAARTVLLAGLTAEVDAVAADIGTWFIPPLAANAGPLVTVQVVFDGPALDTVAGHWDTTADAVVTRLLDTEFRVAFSGFAPGFAYLTGLPEDLAVPRRETPRTRVPAGSVGLAGQYCGVYPRESPGGWQLVGRAVDPAHAHAGAASPHTVLWDPDREPPALLVPGSRVRFTHG